MCIYVYTHILYKLKFYSSYIRKNSEANVNVFDYSYPIHPEPCILTKNSYKYCFVYIFNKTYFHFHPIICILKTLLRCLT